MNVSEYGIRYNIGTDYDISSFTSLALTFTRQSGSTFTRTEVDVTVPAVDLTVTDPVTHETFTFLANKYATYYFKPGDITESGTYRARLAFTDANAIPVPLHLITNDTVTFPVAR